MTTEQYYNLLQGTDIYDEEWFNNYQSFSSKESIKELTFEDYKNLVIDNKLIFSTMQDKIVYNAKINSKIWAVDIRRELYEDEVNVYINDETEPRYNALIGGDGSLLLPQDIEAFILNEIIAYERDKKVKKLLASVNKLPLKK